MKVDSDQQDTTPDLCIYLPSQALPKFLTSGCPACCQRKVPSHPEGQLERAGRSNGDGWQLEGLLPGSRWQDTQDDLVELLTLSCS